MKICPFCKSENSFDAKVCQTCGRSLEEEPGKRSDLRVTGLYLRPGDVLGNRYEILELIGTGGMGMVYKASDRARKGELVAIKVLTQELANDERAVEDLINEANIAMRLSHHNIMRLHNFEDASGYKFLVMEHLEGPTLDKVLGKRKKLSEEETILLARQICDGLDYAHSQNVIHRDLKPSNLMLAKPLPDWQAPLTSPDIHLKICDFGIARIAKDSHTRITGRMTSGTLIYMSPEQIRGKKIDARSDMYSLGCVLYEFLGGEPPFHTGDITYQHLHEKPEPITSVSQWVNGIVQKCLAKEPEARFQSARQLKQALEKEKKLAVKSEYFGSLYVSSEPQGAQIFIDGKPHNAETPATVPKVMVGTHTITLKKTDHDDYETEIEIARDEVTALRGIALARLTGNVTIITEPPEAKVTIADKQGTSPMTLKTVPIGRQKIAIEKEGCVRYQGEIVVEANKTITYELKLAQIVDEILCLKGHTDWVQSVSSSLDGSLIVSGSRDKTVRVWNVEKGQQIRCFIGHKDCVIIVGLSSSGRFALSGSMDRTVRLWDIETGLELRRFKGRKYLPIRAFSPDGRRALSVTKDDTLYLWDVETGREIRCLIGHTSAVYYAAFSPDGHRVISSSQDETIRLWDVESGREIGRFKGHKKEWGPCVAFSHDGRRALYSYDETARLWDVETGRELRRFKGHTRQISCVAFSPDGRRALCGSVDKTISLWDIETGRQIRRFEGHTYAVDCVSFFPNGLCAISGSHDVTIRLWPLPE